MHGYRLAKLRYYCQAQEPLVHLHCVTNAFAAWIARHDGHSINSNVLLASVHRGGMDPSRIESYLRSTCSVLDFDIGELWCARKSSGKISPYTILTTNYLMITND